MMEAFDFLIGNRETLLTNFPKDERGKYEKAIEVYKEKGGIQDFEIRDEAYAMDGSEVYDSLSLHVLKDRRELGDFWSIYKKIKPVWVYEN